MSTSSLSQSRDIEFGIGGVPFTLIEYSDPDTDRDVPLFLPTILGLPLELVTGLANASYLAPEQASQIMAALTPFQIVSKLWVNQVLGQALGQNEQFEEQFIFPGGWYGQQMLLMRRNANLRMRHPLVIDKDPSAVFVARALMGWDSYGEGRGDYRAEVVAADMFGEALHLNPKFAMRSKKAVYVWNGLEHFDPVQAKSFIAAEEQATFCIQSTSMEADDHHAMCRSIDELLDYVPEAKRENDCVMYAGELTSPMGSRFMVVFD